MLERSVSMRKTWILAVVLATLLLGGALLMTRPSQAQSSTSYAVEWNVFGGGLGEMSSTSYRLNATMGQALTGWFEGTNYKVHAGYWQNFVYRVFLPLVMRQ
jgi:hypothetical protein